MPKAGDTFTVKLKRSHVGWGRVRNTRTRTLTDGEGYLPIPSKYAKLYNITNSNHSGNRVYNCTSADGFLVNKLLLASGSSRAGHKLAKNFQGKGNLKLLGSWFSSIKATVGDRVKITFTSSTDVIIEKI